jgi:hypothetical protein
VVGRIVDAVTSFEKVACECVASVVAGQFAVGHHSPQAGARGTRADSEQ